MMRPITGRRLQFVWWRRWQGVGLDRFDGGLALVYRWALWLGWLEVRRWR